MGIRRKRISSFTVINERVKNMIGEIAGAPWGCPYGDRAVKWKE